VATAIPSVLDIAASSLPDRYKEQLLKLKRITKEGSLSSKLRNTVAKSRTGRKPATAARFDEERDRPTETP